ncbi:MAG TPA: NAD(P)/FAD-dependent oxidoreductase [Chloroflexia bacterium]|nr:NAD(P)/FAD-dependent oxidoreductase [Chloroflexia bacterium]
MIETDRRIYDCAVVGAGPAGLSAAVYMGRMRRSVIVVDNNEGRSNWHQVNSNYLGFPDGVHATALRELGREQAERYGAVFYYGYVDDARIEGEGRERLFCLSTGDREIVARTLILATGVEDVFPEFEGSEECIGKSIFWCIMCDGYETIDKRVLVLGSGDRAAALALQLRVFTDRVSLAPWNEPLDFEPDRLESLHKHGVKVYTSLARSFNCAPGKQLASVTLENNVEVPLDSVFVTQRIQPNTQLAKQLGLSHDEHGYIVSDVEQCTNVAGVYAAGDVTRLFNHQVTSAVHEGGMAAAAANYYLYEDWQKE